MRNCLLCSLILVLLTPALKLEASVGKRSTATDAVHLAVKTYKVVLSNPQKSTNREVYIQAPTSSDAGKIAKEQNPGWTVVTVTEVK